MRGLSALRCAEGGAIAAEFALVVPLLLLLGLGMIETARAMWVQSSLQSAAEAAVRCYALERPACDTAAKTAAYAATVAMGVPAGAASFTAGTASCGKKVAASYPFTPATPLVPLSLTIRASACRAAPAP